MKFRFRLGTNDNIGREGWYLDDVIVQSCVPGGLLVDESSNRGHLGLVRDEPVDAAFRSSR